MLWLHRDWSLNLQVANLMFLLDDWCFGFSLLDDVSYFICMTIILLLLKEVDGMYIRDVTRCFDSSTPDMFRFVPYSCSRGQSCLPLAVS